MDKTAHPSGFTHWLEWFVPGALGAAIMLAAVAYPRAGQTAMVLSGDPTRLAQNLPLQGSSLRGHHLIVRMPSDQAGFDALLKGVLLVAVPERLCGSLSSQGNT